MDGPARLTSTKLALTQWQRLHDLLSDLGHTVEVIPPVTGLPDMVCAANGATVIDGRVLIARFRHHQRAPESAAYSSWFRTHGWHTVNQAKHTNEGEGDFLFTGKMILAGTGFRSDTNGHAEARDFFGKPVLSLTLTDPRFYHLDTALAVLGNNQIMYYPGAFTPESNVKLKEFFPNAVQVTQSDAEVFDLNAASDGHHVILPEQADGLSGRLREHGYDPIGVDLTELIKGGGSVKCCTLELQNTINVLDLGQST